MARKTRYQENLNDRAPFRPLQYQVSLTDCVPTSFINSMLWFYRDLPGEVVKTVWEMSLCAGGRDGTSDGRISAITSYLNLAKVDHPNLKLSFVQQFVSAANLTATFSRGGVALLSVVYDAETVHMVMLTDCAAGWYYGFDPYWRRTRTNMSETIQHQPEARHFCGLSARSRELTNFRVWRDTLFGTGRFSVYHERPFPAHFIEVKPSV